MPATSSSMRHGDGTAPSRMPVDHDPRRQEPATAARRLMCRTSISMSFQPFLPKHCQAASIALVLSGHVKQDICARIGQAVNHKIIDDAGTKLDSLDPCAEVFVTAVFGR